MRKTIRNAMIVIQNVNVACAWVGHQPEIPEEAKRFRAF